MPKGLATLAAVLMCFEASAATVQVLATTSGGFGWRPDLGFDDMVAAISLSEPGVIEISASGTVNHGGGDPCCGTGPDGMSFVLTASLVGAFSPLEEREIDKGLVSIPRPIGTTVHDVAALFGAYIAKDRVEAPGFLPRDDDLTPVGIASMDLFKVGSSLLFTANEPGTLFLGVNDGKVDNNSGHFDVTAAVVPLPAAIGLLFAAILGLGPFMRHAGRGGRGHCAG